MSNVLTCRKKNLLEIFLYKYKKFTKSSFFFIFDKMFTPPAIISSILYIFLIYTRNAVAKYIIKPATTLLIIGVSLESSPVRNDIKLTGELKLMCIFLILTHILGLIFSLFGDIFLMFDGELCFIFGLLSFLVAHVFYIKMFYNTRKSNQNIGLLVTLLGLTSLYTSYLYEHVYIEGGYPLFGATVVYAIAITAMAYYAILNSNHALAFGVIMFMISDATLAFDKFVAQSPDTTYEIVVMITYHIAQFCIAKF